MTNDDRGYGPDDMGDDEQEFEVEEFKRYIEDPPGDDLEVTEDDDDDAELAQDWADRHPAAAGHDGTPVDDTDQAAEESAVHERRPPR